MKKGSRNKGLKYVIFKKGLIKENLTETWNGSRATPKLSHFPLNE